MAKAWNLMIVEYIFAVINIIIMSEYLFIFHSNLFSPQYIFFQLLLWWWRQRWKFIEFYAQNVSKNIHKKKELLVLFCLFNFIEGLISNSNLYSLKYVTGMMMNKKKGNNVSKRLWSLKECSIDFHGSLCKEEKGAKEKLSI